jgi:hypothetical protein
MRSSNKNQIGLTMMAIFLCACGGYTQIIERTNREIEKAQKIELSNDTTLLKEYVLANEDSLGLNIKRVTRIKPIQEQSFFYVIREEKRDEILAYKYKPYIESGDFSVVVYHYFDRKGRIIAYKKRIRFLNSICSEDVIVYELTKYFNPQGQSVKSITHLTNLRGKEMNEKDCIMNYPFNDKTYLKASEVPFYSRL